MQSAFEKHQQDQKRALRGVFCVARFNRSQYPVREAVRSTLLGIYIKTLLLCGRGVVVVGQCRSGKSYLLSKTLPGRILSPDRSALLAGQRSLFDTDALPAGMFAVDESSYFEVESLAASFELLEKRKVVFSVQQLEMIHTLKLHELFKDRLNIIYLGSKKEYLTERSRPLPRSPEKYSPYRIVTIYQDIKQLRSSNDSDK